MVAILGANSLSGGGYEIDNSLRFNKPDTPVLRKTFSSSPTETQKCTISFWTKLANPAVTTQKTIFSAIKSGISEDRFGFHGINNGIHGGFELAFNNGSDGSMKIGTGGNTLVRFRDSSAWYHFVIAIDSTQGTASNRVKIYVNGVQNEVESRIEGGAITTDVPLTQNYALGFLTASAHSIGENVESAGSEAYDGYLADFNFIDGTQNAPTDFGEFNDNGVWIPIEYTGTYGNYGFYLEFKQTGTGTDASGMGADTSGNDNHFAPTNLAATDVTTDTPTNNFCTMNPLHSEGITFSEGNLDILAATTNWNVALGTMSIPNSGKWYMEVKITVVQAAGHNTIGFLDSNYPFGSNDTATAFLGGGGSWLTYVYFHAADDNAYVNSADGTAYQFSNNTTFNAGVNDILMMAFDRDNDKVWFGLNDAWAKANGTTGANPSTGADATIVSVQENSARTYMPMMAAGDSSARQQWNFGNAPYAISSGNADANGYGNFEYAVPTGFYSLCTKNLAEFG